MLCLYLPYKLLLARERQHRFNRIVILGMYLAAVIVPLLPPVTFSMSKPAGGSVTAAVGDISAVRLAGGIIEPEAPLWPRVILWIYIIGASVMLLRFLWSYIRLVHIIRSGRRERRDGYTLVSTADAGISPFSWQRYVVVGDAEDADESSAVMIHELRHLAARHSTDIIIAQIYAILVWYNPVSWLMTDELKTVHEYEADDAVIESGANLKEYQMLLIKKTAGVRLPSLANSLNHSKLQKRITMMYQSKSRLAGKVGTLVFVPALAIGMAVVSIPAVASALSDASQATLMESTHKISETLDNPKTAVSPLATGTDAAAATETVSRDTVADNTEASAEPSAIGQETTEIPEQAAGPAEQEQEKVYVAVEQPANFPGGMKA